MAKKSSKTKDNTSSAPATTGELGLEGKGVAPIAIAPIDKAISKYEKAKEKRCEVSPAEIAAKQELSALLHIHRDELPKTATGERFYRYDGKDYILEEKLKCKKVDDENEE